MNDENSGSSDRRPIRSQSTALVAACLALVLTTGCFEEPVGVLPSDPAELNDELFKAVKYQGPRRTIALIDAGAQIDARDLLGWTPLHYAINRMRTSDYRDIGSIKALVEAEGADVGAMSNDGHSPIGLAARHGAIEVLDLLLEHGANFNQLDDAGMTLLMEAVGAGRAEMANHLIDLGANVDEQLPQGGTALFVAVGRKIPAMVRLLINRGASVGGNEKVASPIVFAVATQNQEVVELLLEAGADVNAVRMPSGMTPLHWAVKAGPSMVELLLEAGARREIINREGATALDLARELGDPELIKLLSPTA